MGVFFYYLPGQQVGQLTREAVIQAGLEMPLRDGLETQLAFQERLIQNQVLSRGPDGMSGVLLFAQPRDLLPVNQRVGYFPAEQEWRDYGGHWLGWDKRHLPSPEYLARPTGVKGYEHVLGDERAWECPTIRRLGRYANLPRTMGWGAAGEFEMRILPAYDWAWELAGEIVDRVFGPQRYLFTDVFRLAVAALSINYRIGPREASVLGLITTENFERIFEAAIDWPLLQEFQAPAGDGDLVKKKETDTAAAPVSSSPGPEENSPTTPPAGATSS